MGYNIYMTGAYKANGSTPEIPLTLKGKINMTMTIKEAIANVKQQIKEQEEIVADYESKYTIKELEEVAQIYSDFDYDKDLAAVYEKFEQDNNHPDVLQFRRMTKLSKWSDAKHRIADFKQTLSVPLYYMHEAPAGKLVSPAGIDPHTNIVALQSDYKNS